VPDPKITAKKTRATYEEILSTPLPKIPRRQYTFSGGEHLVRILREKHNIPKDLVFNEYLNLMKKMNPEIKDINIIHVGQKITFPNFDAYSMTTQKEADLEEYLAEYLEDIRGKKIASPVKKAKAPKKTSSLQAKAGIKKTDVVTGNGKRNHLETITNVNDVLDGTLFKSGEFSVPLSERGVITIDTNKFPVLQLTEDKKIILNYGNQLNPDLIDLLQSERSDFEVVTIREKDSIKSVLDKVIDSAGYFSVDKNRNPLVIGDKTQIKIVGDWIIYPDELLEDITVLNLLANKGESVDTHLKDYIRKYGVNLVDIDMKGKTDQGKIDESSNSDQANPESKEMAFINATQTIEIVDSLLSLLGQNVYKDSKVNMFYGDIKGFNLEVKADRYFERGGRKHIIGFTDISQKLRGVIARQGIRFTAIPLTLDDPMMVIEHVLDFLAIRYDSPKPRFAANPSNNNKVEMVVPGILIKQNANEKILLTPLALEKEVYRWLQTKKVKVIQHNGLPVS
jgi:hypothetical protein